MFIFNNLSILSGFTCWGSNPVSFIYCYSFGKKHWGLCVELDFQAQHKIRYNTIKSFKIYYCILSNQNLIMTWVGQSHDVYVEKQNAKGGPKIKPTQSDLYVKEPLRDVIWPFTDSHLWNGVLSNWSSLPKLWPAFTKIWWSNQCVFVFKPEGPQTSVIQHMGKVRSVQCRF